MFNQTLKDIENIYRDDGVYDMNYDEFKKLCRRASEENKIGSRTSVGVLFSQARW